MRRPAAAQQRQLRHRARLARRLGAARPCSAAAGCRGSGGSSNSSEPGRGRWRRPGRRCCWRRWRRSWAHEPAAAAAAAGAAAAAAGGVRGGAPAWLPTCLLLQPARRCLARRQRCPALCRCRCMRTALCCSPLRSPGAAATALHAAAAPLQRGLHGGHAGGAGHWAAIHLRSHHPAAAGGPRPRAVPAGPALLSAVQGRPHTHDALARCRPRSARRANRRCFCCGRSGAATC